MREGIEAALTVPPEPAPQEAAAVLGSGSRISAADTVPLCLWAAAHHDDYAAALSTTVAALGDRDTTCAIVGAIVVLKTGRTGIPREWRGRREPLPAAVRGRR